MAINQFFSFFPKIFKKFIKIEGSLNRSNWNYLLYLFLIFVFFIVFIIISNLINQKNKVEKENLNTIIKSDEFINLSDYFITKINSPYKEIKYSIQNNDSIEKILKKFQINVDDIKTISNSLKQKKLTNIYAGRELLLVLKKLENGSNSIVNLLYPINNTSNIEIRKIQNEFVVKVNILQLYKKEVVVKREIKNNLYSAAIDGGIEPNIIIEFARIFGFEVDFQRDIRKGDWFEILYEKFEDDNNIVQDTGKIIYASMFVNNKELSLYNFKFNNKEGYYDVDVKSVIKTLMKTPINGARLSSSFGLRKHPILGYNKLHQGTDFAAPRGTPIMASGSGIILKAQKYKGYGNFVSIRHNTTYVTAYGHMSKYGRGIRKGVRVNQGQIIGYVGSTGMSTGPHLHYEVIKNGKRINSQRLKLPTGKILSNKARNRFEIERIKIDVRLAALRQNR